MKVKKLRIAFSVACGIVCTLLIALWVRSYWQNDCIEHVDKYDHAIAIGSDRGAIYVTRLVYWGSGLGPLPVPHWRYRSSNVTNTPIPKWIELNFSSPRVRVPVLLPVALSAALAVAPWFRWRFSVRTLLIATTLVAVVLGVIVYAVSN